MKLTLWLLRCYPRRWRERYQEEMLALLEQHSITPKTVIDLFLGALDAQLNAVYRSKGGWTLQHIRDNRSLASIYLSALAVFFLSSTFWMLLVFMNSNGFLSSGASAAILDNPIFAAISYLVFASIPIALLCLVSITIGKAIKKDQWGTVTFALLCLGITLGMFWFTPSIVIPGRNLSDMPGVIDLATILSFLETSFCFGGGLFLIGVNGLKLLHERRRGSLLFALLLGLLPPAGYLLYIVYLSHYNPAGTSLAEWVLTLCYISGWYLALSGLLLTLITGTATRNGWQTTRICGVLLTILLLARLMSMVLWDVNCWIADGGVWIFNPLLINALILAITLACMFLALLRSFLIPEEGPRPIATSEHVEISRIPS